MIRNLFAFPTIKSFTFKQINPTFFIAILLLITFGIYSAYDIRHYADILFWDETLYMQKGLQLWQKIELDWGPFYNVWYKFLSIFTTDKFELYYLNMQILSVLLPVLLFIFLVMYDIEIIWSFIISVLFLYSFINLPVWPKVSHFCLMIFLIALIIVRLLNNVYLKFISILVALALCSYVRPEFYLAFLCLILYSALHFFFFGKNYPLKQIISYVCIILFIYFGIQLIGNPVKSGGNGRMLITFGQHFALNYVQWNHIENKPFWIDWVFYLQDNFIGKSKSEILAIIGKHISSNVFNYLKSISEMLLSFFLPLFHKSVTWLAVIATLVTWIIAIKTSTFNSHILKNILENLKQRKFLFIILLIWCIPTTISSFIAYPRAHYLFLQIPLFALMVAIIIQSIFISSNKYIVFCIITICLFFAKPASKSFDHFDLLRKEKSLCNYTTAKYLANNFKNKQVKVFDFEGNINSILPANFTMNSVDFFTTASTVVSKFIDSTQTDIIYITPSLINSKFTEKDTVLKNWIAFPEKYGFNEIRTGKFDAYLLRRVSTN